MPTPNDPIAAEIAALEAEIEALQNQIEQRARRSNLQQRADMLRRQAAPRPMPQPRPAQPAPRPAAPRTAPAPTPTPQRRTVAQVEADMVRRTEQHKATMAELAATTARVQAMFGEERRRQLLSLTPEGRAALGRQAEA